MTDVKQKLIEARTLIEKKGWNKGHYAVDERNVTVEVWEPGVCAFCTMGAIYAVIDDAYNDDQARPLVNALGFDCSGDVLLWNDDQLRTKDQVLARFDNAIKEITA